MQMVTVAMEKETTGNCKVFRRKYFNKGSFQGKPQQQLDIWEKTEIMWGKEQYLFPRKGHLRSWYNNWNPGAYLILF